MKKILILLSFAAVIFNAYNPVYAEQQQNKTVVISQDKESLHLNAFVEKCLKYSNDHDFNKLQSLYASNYISGDGLKKDELFNLIKQSWDNFPNIKYSSTIKDIRINNNTATVESYDTATADTLKKSDITNDTGALQCESQNLIYLQKFGKDWKIVSDKIFYEKTSIKYGGAKNLKIDFNTAEQVYAGQDYTSALYVDIPTGTIALGSITKEPIVYPEVKTEESFRQIYPGIGVLERIMKANKTNNNEFASASVGFSELIKDNNSNPEIKVTGIALIMQRVNVIPKSSYTPDKPVLKTLDDSFENNDE